MANSFLNRRFKNDGYAGISVIFMTISLAITAAIRLAAVNYGGMANGILEHLVFEPARFFGQGRFWTPLTYSLVNLDLGGYLCYALFLFFFGTRFERMIGSKEFALLYLSSAVIPVLAVAGVSHLLKSDAYVFLGSNAPMMAFLTVYSMFFSNEYVLFFFFIPVRIPILVVLILVLDFVYFVFGAGDIHGLFLSLSAVAYALLYASVRMKMNVIGRLSSAFRRR